MSWTVQFDRARLNLHVEDRISAADAERQEATVEAILARLADQPGVVLADEVGMGKTFVALAVAASVAWVRSDVGPVVVMVPPSLKQKWPRDFDVFRGKCVRKAEDRVDKVLRAGRADTGLEFLQMLDDPKARRRHIIFLTHGALSRGLYDPWTKLAILQVALGASNLARQRAALPRFAAELLELKTTYRAPKVYEELLDANPTAWRGIIGRYGARLTDDPVPRALVEVLRGNSLDLGELHQTLADLPIRTSDRLHERIVAVRRALRRPLSDVWQTLLRHAPFTSPLLILDEAHHLKNPTTQLASLFVESDASEDAGLLEGALQDRFERMLFLTATPFQLGHHELLNVLDRFRGIKWQDGGPTISKESFLEQMATLAKALDEGQFAAAGLDARWSVLADSDAGEPGADLESWWRNAVGDLAKQSERFLVVHRAYEAARIGLRKAEELLRPWVIRHVRPRQLAGTAIARRDTLPGGAIVERSRGDAGLVVDEAALLPFLLAARCEALLTGVRSQAMLGGTGRTVFAEGLASSYEAYLHTRKPDGELTDEHGHADGGTVDDWSDARWYFDRLQKALPDIESHGAHPKIAPTVREAVRLWQAGEKVLVFCHFRETGRALEVHLSAALDELIRRQAAAGLKCSMNEVEAQLEALGRAFDPKRPLHRKLNALVAGILEGYPELSREEAGRVEEIVRRFVRTPSFLVRYFPLGKGAKERALVDAFAKADDSGVALRSKVEGFVAFLAKRCQPAERAEYIGALENVQTGERYRRDSKAEGDRAGRLLPNVRLANGGVEQHIRSNLMLAFNTPFFPDILIASSVLAEGVDLHLDCRYVVHHDLCWNPSTLEQRTGRVDRLGCKAEQVTQPINVYLPYVGGTQDEKMYRVVRDRERWFQVVMGEKFALDDTVVERLATRLPLPEAAAKGLAMRLEVTR